MAKIVGKGHKTWKDGSVMTYRITDDGVLTVSGSCPCREDLGSRYPDLIPKEGEPAVLPELGFNDLIDENRHAVIPDAANEIEGCAFARCRNLVRVDIPGSEKVIGISAFFGCTRLTTVVILEGVEEKSRNAPSWVAPTSLTSPCLKV